MPRAEVDGLSINYDVQGFQHLAHAALHEDPEAFKSATLEFLLRQRG